MKYENPLQKYWSNPNDEINSPLAYTKYPKRSEYLLTIFRKYVNKSFSVAEIGCNVGRNLNALFEEGYKDLTGIEINSIAIKESKKHYPKLKAKLLNQTIEKWVKGEQQYDCIFSMAVMIHLPEESDCVFSEIMRKAKKVIITIEDENNSTWKHFPRNYHNIFAHNGWMEVFSEKLDGPDALKDYVTRIFIKIPINKEVSGNWIYYDPYFEFTSLLPIESSAWSGHFFFAYDLISNIKPKVIVELGTHKGNSLFSFAQAIKDNDLKTKLHGIDTWEGDKQAGYYGETVYKTFLMIKDKYYKNIDIIPHKMFFDEAIKDFKDNSIDILHIDGLHTYEAVKHDFETWLPKVNKDNGIILFHDACEKSNDFGVYKLWEELQKKYKTITFEHYHGLGVLFLGQNIFEEKDLPRIFLLKYYSNISELHDLRKQMSDNNTSIENLINENLSRLELTKTLILKNNQILMEKNAELQKIYNSKSWKLTQPLRKLYKIIKTNYIKVKDLCKN